MYFTSLHRIAMIGASPSLQLAESCCIDCFRNNATMGIFDLNTQAAIAYDYRIGRGILNRQVGRNDDVSTLETSGGRNNGTLRRVQTWNRRTSTRSPTGFLE
jgi:hypothetical protein